MIAKNREDRIINLVTVVISILVLIVTLYPIYYCLINSFNEGKDAVSGGIYFWPRAFTLDNYIMVFRNKNLLGAFSMTVLRTVVGTAAAIIGTSMAAYALANKKLIGRKFYMVFGLVTLYFPTSVVYSYLLYSQIGLLNNFLVYILPNIFQFYYIVLFISFINDLPDALLESAKIDGANEFVTLFKIVIPLSKPIIATLALFAGVWHWNDWFHPAFFITNEKLMTLPAVLMRTMSLTQAQQELQKVLSVSSSASVTTPESIRYAMLMIAVAPITIVYPYIQKYFVKGMMIGSVKG
ncbi:carbohydrate ABC transporter permease [Anaerocolumna sp. AGMB13025]|uniref:carbohydrate ABC transporter permease n=1 Tax=Anaerocolumna sp. AGMB13025 TaxID=3039116 RepID=UPI00241E6C68|nr:carbohydrate ABC transporter permease [Anaerocolumna sp. AGMB13025]WFR56680.1 carbohydrate ABC transporter permease [Anaerocolumna sp. AGMB13025]